MTARALAGEPSSMALAGVTDQSDANNAAVAVIVNARLRIGYSWRFLHGNHRGTSYSDNDNLPTSFLDALGGWTGAAGRGARGCAAAPLHHSPQNRAVGQGVFVEAGAERSGVLSAAKSPHWHSGITHVTPWICHGPHVCSVANHNSGRS
jgi:hypothetical protein